MNGDEPEERLRHAEAVRAAARLSLAAPGVRVHRSRVREAEGSWTEPWSWEVGDADPSARSVRLRHCWAEDSPLEKVTDASVRLSEAAARRWPWLAGETPSQAPAHGDGETNKIDYQTIEIGRKWYGGGPHVWSDRSDKLTYAPARLLWPLEAILGTTAAAHAGITDVRGESCVRYVGEAQPGEVADRVEIELIDPPRPDDDWRKLAIDVCVDSKGLVRRIAWSPTIGTQFKLGWLPRLAAILERSSTSDDGVDRAGRLWNIVELWDYGCHIEICAPTDLLDLGEAPTVGTIVLNLWRKKQQHKQRTH